MIVKNEVLLLKSQDDENNKYESILVKNGFTVKYLQILDFEYVNLNNLVNKLNNPHNYDGIIFTSPRAVLATKLSLSETKLESWINKRNFVVGEATYNLVLKELGISCNGKDSGNANNLADLIIKECAEKKYKMFLFPCGNLKKETLETRLSSHNINLDATTVYETVQNPNIKESIKSISSNFENLSEYIVYFSPSGVKYTTNVFRDIFDNKVQQLKLVAIGPSTNEALLAENLPVFSVAKKPNDEELLNAILRKS